MERERKSTAESAEDAAEEDAKPIKRLTIGKQIRAVQQLLENVRQEHERHKSSSAHVVATGCTVVDKGVEGGHGRGGDASV
jgi:hypothetical protein